DVIPRRNPFDRTAAHVNGRGPDAAGRHDALRSHDQVRHWRRRVTRIAHTGEVRVMWIATGLAGCDDDGAPPPAVERWCRPARSRARITPASRPPRSRRRARRAPYR